MVAPDKLTTFQQCVFHHQVMWKAKLKVISRWFKVRCGSRAHSRRWQILNQTVRVEAISELIAVEQQWVETKKLLPWDVWLCRDLELCNLESYLQGSQEFVLFLRKHNSNPARANGGSAGPNLVLFWSRVVASAIASVLLRGLKEPKILLLLQSLTKPQLPSK